MCLLLTAQISQWKSTFLRYFHQTDKKSHHYMTTRTCICYGLLLKDNYRQTELSMIHNLGFSMDGIVIPTGWATTYVCWCNRSTVIPTLHCTVPQTKEEASSLCEKITYFLNSPCILNCNIKHLTQVPIQIILNSLYFHWTMQRTLQYLVLCWWFWLWFNYIIYWLVFLICPLFSIFSVIYLLQFDLYEG